MRKDTSIITSAIVPEKQETITKLTDLHRTTAQMDRVMQETSVVKDMTRKTIDAEEADFELMMSKIMAYPSVDALKGLTEEDLNLIFIDSKGEQIKFTGTKKITEQELKDLRRDYVEFVYQSETELARLDEAKVELEKMINESDDEIKEIFESIGGDITTYIENTLEESLAALEAKDIRTTEETEQLQKLQLVLDKLGESITLASVIDYVEKYDAHNILNDYKRRSEDVGKQYARAVKRINLTLNLTSFKNLEPLFIENKALHQYTDLFTFIVMRYIANKKDINVLDGVFISQLAYELRSLYTNNPDTLVDAPKERRQLLLANIERVLSTVYHKAGIISQ